MSRQQGRPESRLVSQQPKRARQQDPDAQMRITTSMPRSIVPHLWDTTQHVALHPRSSRQHKPTGRVSTNGCSTRIPPPKKKTKVDVGRCSPIPKSAPKSLFPWVWKRQFAHLWARLHCNKSRGNPNGAKQIILWGLGPKSVNWANDGLFGAISALPPVAVRCGGVGPERPRKGPNRCWKGPNQPRTPKNMIFWERSPPDFLRKFEV